MAKGKGVRVVLLVEDEYLERFARNALGALGFSRHEMRVRPYPVSKNMKLWVSKEYPKEVLLYRQQANHQQVALLVGTDADQQAVPERHGALAAALTGAGLGARENHERVVLWIPKWHIETWLLFLIGRNVEEDRSYKHDVHDPDVAAAARVFIARLREFQQDPSIPALPAMKTAFQETARLGI